MTIQMLSRVSRSIVQSPKTTKSRQFASLPFAAAASGNSSTLTELRNSNSKYHNVSSRRKYTTYSQLPEEHQMIYDMCRKFADEELAPNAGEWDQKHEFPQDAITKLVRKNCAIYRQAHVLDCDFIFS